MKRAGERGDGVGVCGTDISAEPDRRRRERVEGIEGGRKKVERKG